MTVTLSAPPTADGPALTLRPWRLTDAAALAAAHRDPRLRRWLTRVAADEAGALELIRAQITGWEQGTRYGFAVLTDSGADGDPGGLVGSAVLKTPPEREPNTAEVGYWTAAAARGRGVAPRAVTAVSAWAFRTLPGLERLELLHEVGNHASCRVADKCGYVFRADLPPRPPEYPNPGHLHVKSAPATTPPPRAAGTKPGSD